MKPLTHASVFSGIGGPECAAVMLGWENLFHCEINPFGKQVLDYWFPKSESYEDITKTDFSKWRGRVNVLTGGFPCQPFSYAGQRRGAEDDRYLWPYMFRCIDQIRPDWVVAENVAGITTMVEQGEVSPMASQASLFDEEDGVRGYRLSETFTLERICNDLESHGYSVQPILIPACAVGAPHRRDRVFIVARRVTADTRSGGQSAPEQQSERERTQVQQQSGEQSQHGIGRPSASRPIADTEDLQRDGSIVGHGGQPLREQMPELGNGCGTSDAPSDPTISGEGTPGEGGGIEGCGRNANQQPCEWGATPEWSDGFYAILRSSANTRDNGLQHDTERGCQGGMPKTERGRGEDDISEQTESTEAVGSGRVVADTKSKQGERLRPQQPNTCGVQQEQPGGRGGEDGCRGISAYTDSIGLHGGYGSNQEGHGRTAFGFAETHDGCPHDSVRREWETEQVCGFRWRDFPTVSPVHRGNDGLPFNVDDLTISFNKWRTESLKAYGNAICVQVIYEIFRAIQLVEDESA